MYSSLIGKIQKANLYAREPDRVRFTEFTTTFKGDNDWHTVSYQSGHWTCTCDSFPKWKLCSHAMAIEKMISQMLPEEAHRALSLSTEAAPAS